MLFISISSRLGCKVPNVNNKCQNFFDSASRLLIISSHIHQCLPICSITLFSFQDLCVCVWLQFWITALFSHPCSVHDSIDLSVIHRSWHLFNLRAGHDSTMKNERIIISVSAYSILNIVWNRWMIIDWYSLFQWKSIELYLNSKHTFFSYRGIRFVNLLYSSSSSKKFPASWSASFTFVSATNFVSCSLRRP